MTTLVLKDANGALVYVKGTGAGSVGDPFSPTNNATITDGTNSLAIETVGADATSNTQNNLTVTARSKVFNGSTWDRVRGGVSTATATLTGFKNVLSMGHYNATPATRTDGQAGILETDNGGRLLTNSNVSKGSGVIDSTTTRTVPASDAVFNPDITATGNITTQNLVPTGVATSGSAVALALNSKGTLVIQVTGTYTGALSLQVTNDDTNWVTQGGNSPFMQRMSDNATFVRILSGSNDIYQCDVTGHSQVRITALSAVTGTAVISMRASQGNSTVSISESAVNLDKYSSITGDLNFSENTTLNSYIQALYRDDELWDTALVGGGTCTWSQAAGGCTMTVTSTNDAVIRESKLAAQYLAAAPQVWDLTAADMSPVTGVIKRYGYFSATTVSPFETGVDGFLLETDDTQVYFKVYKNGSAIFSAAQSTWDDPLDGKGRSSILIDWTKFNALQGEFLYLGGTQADFGFLIGGSRTVIAHTFKNSNVNATTFVNSPHQKVRYSIRRVSGSGAASTVQICSKVGSKGQNDQKIKNREHLYAVGTLPAGYTFQPVTIGTEYAWIGVKLNTRMALAWIHKLDVTSGTADDFVIRIRRNPTFGGSGSLAYSAITYAPYSIGLAPTPSSPTVTVSGGTIIFQKIVSATANQEYFFDIENLLLYLGQAINGTFDEFVFSFEPVTANLNIRGSVSIGTNN